VKKYLLLLALILLPSFAFIDNCNARIPIDLVISSDLTTEPIKLNITYDPDMETDFTDLNFTDENNNVLNWWMRQKVDSQWVEVLVQNDWHNLTSGYVYFSCDYNSSWGEIKSISINGAGDNFNDGSINATMWDITDVDCTSITESNGYAVVSSSGSQCDLALKTTITTENDFRAFVNVNLYTTSYSYFIYRFDAANDRWFHSGRVPDDEWRLYNGVGLEDTHSSTITADTWYNLEYQIYGTNHTILVDGISFTSITNADFTDAGNFYVSDIGDIMYLDDFVIMKYSGITPIVAYGTKEINSLLEFVFIPTSPNVLEPVNFEVNNNGINITRYWWDFGDGTSIVSDTINITSHTYSKGGTYTVNLTGLNETTNNISVSQSIIVFEPTTTIWAKDIIGDGYIENFTVIASNSTNTTSFTANGFTANWNFSEGPYGNVSIYIESTGFNHTIEYISITNSSNVNFTTSLYPALFIFTPRDVDYHNVIVPIKSTMTNISASKIQESGWEVISINSVTQANNGETTNTSLNITGQIWKVELIASANFGDSVVNNSLKFFSEELNESSTIFMASAINAKTNPYDITVYVYLKRDGTYKILNSDQTTNKTGTFPFFPARLQSTAYAKIFSGFPADWAIATVKINQPSSSLYFYQPDDALTGNITTVFEQSTTGFFGYLENIYDSNKMAFKNVGEMQLFNNTIYMLTTSRSKEVKITTVDRSENAITNTLVVFNLFVDGVWRVFASGVTDGTGILKLNLDEDATYLVTISASGYSPQVITITQPESEYKFYLSTQFAFFETPLDNLALSLTPTDTSIYSNTSYWFNYTVVDGDTQTDLIKLTLKDKIKIEAFYLLKQVQEILLEEL